MIRLASNSDIEQIKRVYQERFYTDNEYTTKVFRYLFPSSKCFVYIENEQIISTLFLIPINYYFKENIHSGYYLYGVATSKIASGRGIGKQLLKFAINQSKAENKKFIICRPANAKLFEYYNELGFTTNISKVPYKIPDQVIENISNLPSAAKMLNEDITLDFSHRFMWPVEILENIFQIEDIESQLETTTQKEEKFLMANILDSTVAKDFSSESFFIFPME